MNPDFDVAIVGAGPYGIGAGARLRELAGLDVRVFGEPMEFWNSHMPEGMLLVLLGMRRISARAGS